MNSKFALTGKYCAYTVANQNIALRYQIHAERTVRKIKNLVAPATKKMEKLAELSPVYIFLKLAQLNLIFFINIHMYCIWIAFYEK